MQNIANQQSERNTTRSAAANIENKNISQQETNNQSQSVANNVASSATSQQQDANNQSQSVANNVASTTTSQQQETVNETQLAEGNEEESVKSKEVKTVSESQPVPTNVENITAPQQTETNPQIQTTAPSVVNTSVQETTQDKPTEQEAEESEHEEIGLDSMQGSKNVVENAQNDDDENQDSPSKLKVFLNEIDAFLKNNVDSQEQKITLDSSKIDTGVSKVDNVSKQAGAEVASVVPNVEPIQNSDKEKLDPSITIAISTDIQKIYSACSDTTKQAMANLKDVAVKKFRQGAIDIYLELQTSVLDVKAVKEAENINLAYGEIFFKGQEYVDTEITALSDTVGEYIETEIQRILSDIDKAEDAVENYVESKEGDEREYAVKVANEGQMILYNNIRSVQGGVGDIANALAAETKYFLEGQVASAFQRFAKVFQPKDSWIDSTCDFLSSAGSFIKTFVEKYNAFTLTKALVNTAVNLFSIVQLFDDIIKILGRVKHLAKRIIDNFKSFFSNLLKAFKKGFTKFMSNILTHLKNGLLEWLLGDTPANMGISSMPTFTNFSLESLKTFALEIMGISGNYLYLKVKTKFGAAIADRAKDEFIILRDAITDGPLGLIKYFKDDFASLATDVMKEITTMVMEKLIVEGIKMLILMSNPVGGAAKVGECILDLLQFIDEKGSDLVELINNVLDTAEDLLNGNIDKAANMLEKILAAAIPLLIDVLARFLNINDIPAAIKDVIETLRSPVDTIVDGILNTIGDLGADYGDRGFDAAAGDYDTLDSIASIAKPVPATDETKKETKIASKRGEKTTPGVKKGPQEMAVRVKKGPQETTAGVKKGSQEKGVKKVGAQEKTPPVNEQKTSEAPVTNSESKVSKESSDLMDRIIEKLGVLTEVIKKSIEALAAGITVSNASLSVVEDSVGMNIVGGADLDISFPQISGTAHNIKLGLNLQSTEIYFTVPTIEFFNEVLGTFTVSDFNYSSFTEGITASNANIPLDLVGKKETLDIVNPVINKSGFDFDSAELKGEGGQKMFNDIATVEQYELALIKNGANYELGGKGLLTIEPTEELKGTSEASFLYSKAEGFKIKDFNIEFNVGNYSPLQGVEISDILLKFAKSEENSEITGTGNIEVSLPGVEGSASGLVLTINPKDKTVSFDVSSIKIITDLGEIDVSNLQYSNEQGSVLSGDNAGLTIDIAGMVESLNIINPSISQAGFDFTSAEGKGSGGQKMFNDIVTIGEHSIKLTKTDKGNEIEGYGALHISLLDGEVEGDAKGGFIYNKTDGLTPTDLEGKVSINKDYELIPGVSIKNLFVEFGKDLNENQVFSGGGTLDLAIANPQISGTSKNMKLTINPKTKGMSFEIGNITVSSGLGVMNISNLSFADGVINAEEGKFLFDSSNFSNMSYFSGNAAKMMKRLSGVGVILDITARGISLSNTEGKRFSIAEIETSLNEIKIPLFGHELTYNFKEQKATLEIRKNLLRLLTGREDLGVNIIIPLFTGVSAVFGVGIKNAGDILLKIELAKKPEGNFWNLLLEANLEGSEVMAYISGGIQLGLPWLASVYAGLSAEGGVKFNAPSRLRAESEIQTGTGDGKRMIPKPTNLNIDMELLIPLILQLKLLLKSQVLFFKFQHEQQLAEKKLAEFNPKKRFSWNTGGELKGNLNAKDILNKEKVNESVEKCSFSKKYLSDKGIKEKKKILPKISIPKISIPRFIRRRRRRR